MASCLCGLQVETGATDLQQASDDEKTSRILIWIKLRSDDRGLGLGRAPGDPC
jgi:hypothetical protein